MTENLLENVGDSSGCVGEVESVSPVLLSF
jgi:hypothetical protein